jgi:hypothetical protein
MDEPPQFFHPEWKIRMHAKFWSHILKGKDYMDLGKNKRIILEHVLEK